VASGADLVGDAAGKLEETLRGVRSISEMMSGIASDSQSQAQRIGEVSAAVRQIGELTQHNAALDSNVERDRRADIHVVGKIDKVLARARTGPLTGGSAMRLLKGSLVAAVFFTVVLSGSTSLGQDDWRADYAVGDEVMFSISGRDIDMQPCMIVQNDAGSAMRVECEKYKHWPAGDYMVYEAGSLSAAAPGPGGQGNGGQANGRLDPAKFPEFEWRAGYPVGSTVSFTISGRPGDAQPCTVSENTPNSVMRVRCETFKTWRAGEYPVYASEYVEAAGGAPGWNNLGLACCAPDPEPVPPVPPVTGEVKLGNYACYGSGGAVLAGFNFNLLAGNRYVDASGNNGGEYSVEGGDIVFAGGELDGMRYRQTAPNHYRLGAQASCEPF